MPLGDRRAMNMINITGGAVFVNYDCGQKPNFSLAGGRTQSQMFWIDGGTGQNMRLGIGQIDTDPPVETLQEVKVMANGYSAEYGGSAGGVIIATTKSGTNQLPRQPVRVPAQQPSGRAELLRSHRRRREDESRRCATTCSAAPSAGPCGATRRSSSSPTKARAAATAPSALSPCRPICKRPATSPADLNAAALMIPIYDPATTRTEGGRTVRDPFPGNRIPANRIDPVAAEPAQVLPGGQPRAGQPRRRQ